jgi:hypothetical protein
MPRWASRITLEIVDVRVQRVQEISEEDAKAEGLCSFSPEFGSHGLVYGWGGERINGFTSWAYPKDAFWALWDSINAKRGYGWDTNCWVWVIEFRNEKPVTLMSERAGCPQTLSPVAGAQ